MSGSRSWQSNRRELEDQLSRLKSSLAGYTEQLSATEADYRRLAGRRRELREKLEEGQDRRGEIGSLLERFDLLGRHYSSDIERIENGNLFSVLGRTPGPWRPPENHRVKATAAMSMLLWPPRATRSPRFELLHSELGDKFMHCAVKGRFRPPAAVESEEELSSLSSEIEGLTSPKLRQLRASYGELADKRARFARLWRSIARFRTWRSGAKTSKRPTSAHPAVSDGDLPTTIAESFAQCVEVILKAWHFPDAERSISTPRRATW